MAVTSHRRDPHSQILRLVEFRPRANHHEVLQPTYLSGSRDAIRGVQVLYVYHSGG